MLNATRGAKSPLFFLFSEFTYKHLTMSLFADYEPFSQAVFLLFCKFYHSPKRNLIQKLFYKMLQNALDNVGMCDIIENVGCELQQKMGKR